MLEWLLFVFFGVFAFFCVRDFDPCLLINIEGRGSGSGDLVKIVRLALLRLVPAKPMEVSWKKRVLFAALVLVRRSSVSDDARWGLHGTTTCGNIIGRSAAAGSMSRYEPCDKRSHSINNLAGVLAPSSCASKSCTKPWKTRTEACPELTAASLPTNLVHLYSYKERSATSAKDNKMVFLFLDHPMCRVWPAALRSSQWNRAHWELNYRPQHLRHNPSNDLELPTVFVLGGYDCPCPALFYRSDVALLSWVAFWLMGRTYPSSCEPKNRECVWFVLFVGFLFVLVWHWYSSGWNIFFFGKIFAFVSCF